MEGLGVQQHQYYLILHAKYDLWAVPKIDRKSMPKMLEKETKINPQNDRRPDFGDFGAFRKDVIFR